MNQTELMLAAAGGLFLAFVLGWLAGWITLRAGDPPRPGVSPSEPLTLGAADRLAAAERDLATARADLRAARTEIADLRAVLDRAPDRPTGAPDAP